MTNNDNTTAILALGTGAVAAYLASRGMGGETKGGGMLPGGEGDRKNAFDRFGWESGPTREDNRSTDPRQSSDPDDNTEPDRTNRSEPAVDTSINRLAKSQSEAKKVKEAQKDAHNDPNVTPGTISGMDPDKANIGVTASAGGGRGPRFDSSSGGEAVLSVDDDDEQDTDSMTRRTKSAVRKLKDGNTSQIGGL